MTHYSGLDALAEQHRISRIMDRVMGWFVLFILGLLGASWVIG